MVEYTRHIADTTVVAMEEAPREIARAVTDHPNLWSYKDRLMGVNGGDQEEYEKEDEKYWDEEDFSEDEDEEEQRRRNALCLRVEVNRERRIKLCRKWRRTLIIKVLGKVMGYKFLYDKIQKLWNPKGAMEMIDIPNNFYVVRFSDDKDLNYALEEGPWMVAGHYLICQRWKPEFDAYEDDVGKQAVWVRIPRLPIEYYEKDLLWEAGYEIGKTLKVEEHTLNEKKGNMDMFLTERGQFARLCVEVDLRKTLVPKVRIRKKEYPVEYEGLPLICFECGRFGHRKEQCPLVVKPPEKMEVHAQMGQGTTARGKATIYSDKDSTEGNFSPWMIPQRRKWRGKNNNYSGNNDARSSAEHHRNKGKGILSNGKDLENNSRVNKYDALGDLMEEDPKVMGNYGEKDSAILMSNVGPKPLAQDTILGHRIINSANSSKNSGAGSSDQGRSMGQRGTPKNKNGGGQGSNASGPSRNTESRAGKSPKKTDIVVRPRERVGRFGALKTSLNSVTSSKGIGRGSNVDVRSSKSDNKGGNMGEDDLAALKPSDDTEFWRMMKYEEKRLKEAGQDPMDVSGFATSGHTNFL